MCYIHKDIVCWQLCQSHKAAEKLLDVRKRETVPEGFFLSQYDDEGLPVSRERGSFVAGVLCRVSNVFALFVRHCL